MADAVPPGPRTWSSSREAATDAAGVLRRARPLLAVYLRRRLAPDLRACVMAAVRQADACGAGDPGRLDPRRRAAVVYATALTARRFRGRPDPHVIAAASEHLSAQEREDIEALARAVTLADLTLTTGEHVAGAGRRRRLRRGRGVASLR